MGQPSEVKAARVAGNYNWGDFGSADSAGVNFNPVVSESIRDAQAGTNKYLNELMNPSYDNASFRARQDILDANNHQYAVQAGADAIARGARGSATQNILNSIAANRNNDLRMAMTQEDARIAGILANTQGVEGNYFNQGNMMANNILQRVTGNQAAQNTANQTNTANYNQWMNSLIGAGGSLAGAGLGAGLGAAFAPASASALSSVYSAPIGPTISGAPMSARYIV